MNNTEFRQHLLGQIKKTFEYDLQNINELIFQLFEYQFLNNSVYQRFCQLIDRSPSSVNSIEAIPFLPIEVFKKNTIKSGEWQEERIFGSSGTTAGLDNKSLHYIRDLKWYEWVSGQIWKATMGSDLSNFHFFGLLPSYLDRADSSLVYMVNHFIQQSTGGFYLNNLENLVADVEKCMESGQRIPVVLGVSFALLDLVEKYTLNWEGVRIIETGGMKKRRKELTRSELHELLKRGLNVDYIFSEYGMTELLSQSYSKMDGLFDMPGGMKIVITDTTDPLSTVRDGKEGLINVIDLANIDTCSFIGTSDLGKKISEKQFIVTGRFDNAEVRGCNLMVSDL